MYAVVETGGKQYLLREGDEVLVEKLEGEKDAKVDLNVLFLSDEKGKTSIGTPMISGAKVKCKIVRQELGPKVTIFTYRKRKDSRRLRGHRQNLTRLSVEKIEGL